MKNTEMDKILYTSIGLCTCVGMCIYSKVGGSNCVSDLKGIGIQDVVHK